MAADEPGDPAVPASVDELASRERAAAAGVGLVIVALAYGPSDLGDPDRWWAAGVAIVLAVALADLLPEVRSLLPVPGVAPATIAVALVAIYLCVPETDQVPIAALVPGVVIALELVQRRQIGIEWYALAAASVGWAGMFGASARQSALVGALFAWWAVALLPLVHRIRPVTDLWVAIGVALIGGAAAFVMARTGGTADSGTTAALAVVAAAVVSAGLAIALVALTGARAEPSEAADAA